MSTKYMIVGVRLVVCGMKDTFIVKMRTGEIAMLWVSVTGYFYYEILVRGNV